MVSERKVLGKRERHSRMENNKAKSGSIGLTYIMLARSNYTAWALKMKVVIKAQGVWNVVEPKDPKKAVDDKTDKVALAMIYQGISEEILLSLADKEMVKDAWETIKMLYQGADRVKKVKIQTLKAEFEALTMKDDEMIDDFYMKMNRIMTNTRAV